ncbi:hypothetical protein PR048_017074 [Dryococelus australis]|uniref:Homing endonuclease LAGLIDADG domain-containing protein n=1 Tax=Dryococelus australis TaxID=614101 RepID=A0ABQ9H8K9_9NEOP|nr:hypothetical protein PR048_017074 [Dryococelus australis]
MPHIYPFLSPAMSQERVLHTQTLLTYLNQHLDVPRTQRQKVKRAAWLLSNKADLEKLQHILNDWFDVLNSWYPFNTDKSKLAYRLYKLEQDRILSEMGEFIFLVRVLGHRNEMPSRLGIRVINNSFKNLFHYLKGKYGITYIPNDKSNKDILKISFLYN